MIYRLRLGRAWGIENYCRERREGVLTRSPQTDRRTSDAFRKYGPDGSGIGIRGRREGSSASQKTLGRYQISRSF